MEPLNILDLGLTVKMDYGLDDELEEWVGGTYRIDKDFHRLTIYTEKAQKALWHMFGKMVPLNTKIKLDNEEADMLKNALWHDSDYNLYGTYGAYRVKSFDVMAFYGTEDATATEEELAYEYEWKDL